MIVSLGLAYLTYYKMQSKLKYLILISNLFFLIWVLMQYLHSNFSYNMNVQLFLLRSRLIFLAFALFFITIFYTTINSEDSISNLNLLSSLILGINVGGALTNIIYRVDNGTLTTIFYYDLTLLPQAIIFFISLNQYLSSRYQLAKELKFSSKITPKLLFQLKIGTILFLLLSLLLIPFGREFFITPFYLLIPSVLVVLSYLTYIDPLTATPIKNPLNFIALFNSRELILYHVFSQDHDIAKFDFGAVIMDITKLMREMVATDSNLTHIATMKEDIFFEYSGSKTLILICQKNSPILHEIFHNFADDVFLSDTETYPLFLQKMSYYFKFPLIPTPQNFFGLTETV